MSILQDSIQAINEAHVSSADTVAHAHYKPRTPYQVLRMLPADATPEQQDSAIQANFQPAEIHYSQRPDTLHLPGHKAPKTMKWQDVPVYYKETFFSNDSLFKKEYKEMHNGVPGVAIPYTMRTDPYIAIALLGCFFISTIIISQIRRLIISKLKAIFRISAFHTEKETTSEIYAMLTLNVISAMLISFFMSSCAQHFISDTYILPTQYHLIGIFLALIFAYKTVKLLCYSIVNPTFWSGKQNLQYLDSKIFIEATGVPLLLFIVMLQVYFELSIIYTMLLFVFIELTLKSLTFYRCYVIFFRQSRGFFHFFLYLCALEIIPLAVLWTAALMTANILKVNF